MIHFPRKGAPFYRIKFISEAIADAVRGHYREFLMAGLTVTEDLTSQERAERNAIRTIMTTYWKIPTFPNSRFSRSLLKCKVDGNFSFLSLAEV